MAVTVPRETRSGMLRETVFVLNQISPAYKRAERAGFRFNAPRACRLELADGWAVAFTFTCVCGRLECATFTVLDHEVLELRRMDRHPYIEFLCKGGAIDVGVIDCAAMLEDWGAFGEAHLRQDGYSEDEIARIREPWVLQS